MVFKIASLMSRRITKSVAWQAHMRIGVRIVVCMGVRIGTCIGIGVRIRVDRKTFNNYSRYGLNIAI